MILMIAVYKEDIGFELCISSPGITVNLFIPENPTIPADDNVVLVGQLFPCTEPLELA